MSCRFQQGSAFEKLNKFSNIGIPEDPMRSFISTCLIDFLIPYSKGSRHRQLQQVQALVYRLRLG